MISVLYSYWFPKVFGFRLNEKWGKRAFWSWLIGFQLAFLPLYLLGAMGMPRRMEHYSNPEWQPYLVVAALGAALILVGIGCLIMQLVVSIRERHRTTDPIGDPWDGRTLEWATASPPPVYNFAVTPVVRDLDAFTEMKERGMAYVKPARYQDIHLPKNTAAGFVLGGLAFTLGFALVWHIWWLTGAAALSILGTLVVRSFMDDTEYLVPASEVERIEEARFARLAAAGATSTDYSKAHPDLAYQV